MPLTSCSRRIGATWQWDDAPKKAKKTSEWDAAPTKEKQPSGWGKSFRMSFGLTSLSKPSDASASQEGAGGSGKAKKTYSAWPAKKSAGKFQPPTATREPEPQSYRFSFGLSSLGDSLGFGEASGGGGSGSGGGKKTKKEKKAAAPAAEEPSFFASVLDPFGFFSPAAAPAPAPAVAKSPSALGERMAAKQVLAPTPQCQACMDLRGAKELPGVDGRGIGFTRPSRRAQVRGKDKRSSWEGLEGETYADKVSEKASNRDKRLKEKRGARAENLGTAKKDEEEGFTFFGLSLW